MDDPCGIVTARADKSQQPRLQQPAASLGPLGPRVSADPGGGDAETPGPRGGAQKREEA